MKRYICGVDVGAKGAAVILKDGKHYDSICFDDSSGKFKIKEVGKFFLKHRKLDIHIYIEDVRSVFMSSAKANFSFGENKGILTGMIDILCIPYTFVYSKTWQKLAWQGVRPVTKKVKGKDTTDTKKTSLIACNRLFPKANLLRTPKCKTQHDGLCDAYLIAFYGSAFFKDGD